MGNLKSFLLALAIPCVHSLVLPDGVGRLPALGWNSWNAFHCDVDAEKIMTAANKLVSLGLKDSGYEYVNIDDCWAVKDKRNATNNRIMPDPVTFPDGIHGVAKQIHDLGLKVGLYSSAGTETCAGYPASINLEYIDATTFAEWDIDYLKYDNCNIPANWTDEYEACVPDSYSTIPADQHNGTCLTTNLTAPPGYDWGTSLTALRFRNMRDAILAQNRTILYSLCEWGHETGSSWRTTFDIGPFWGSVARILNLNSFQLNKVDFWGHADPDMLELGNGNLTIEENRSHFALWAAMKSPLIIGTALDLLHPDVVDILKNKYLLAFSQDAVFGKPATPYNWDWSFNQTHPADHWSGQSSAGTLVLLLNTLEGNQKMRASWNEVPGLSWWRGYRVTEVWTGKSLGCKRLGVNFNVASHDTAAILVGKPCLL